MAASVQENKSKHKSLNCNDYESFLILTKQNNVLI